MEEEPNQSSPEIDENDVQISADSGMKVNNVRQISNQVKFAKRFRCVYCRLD